MKTCNINYLYLIFLFVLSLNLACAPSQKIINSQLKEIDISEKSEIKGFHDLIQNYRYIKLETSPECLITKIDKLIWRKKNIFILDAKNKCIFIFNEEGKYQTKIHNIGRGPTEYNYIMDFDLDDNGNIYISDMNLKKIIVYNVRGEFLNQFKININAQNLAVVDSNNIVVYQPYSFNSDKFDKIVFINKQKETFSSLTYSGDRQSGLRLLKPFSLTHQNGIILFNEDLSDTIMEINQYNIHLNYAINFGKYSIASQNRVNKELFIYPKGVINEGWRINNFFKTPDYLTFSFNYLNKSWFAFYSLKTGKKSYISCPTCGIEKVKVVSEFRPIAVKDQYFVSMVDLNIISSYKKILIENKDLNQPFLSNDARNLVENFKEGDNPILLIYTLPKQTFSL